MDVFSREGLTSGYYGRHEHDFRTNLFTGTDHQRFHQQFDLFLPGKDGRRLHPRPSNRFNPSETVSTYTR